MKKRLFRAGLSLLIVLLFLSNMVAAAVGETVYTSRQWLADNLEYTNIINWSSSPGRTESFAVRMTGQGDAYPIIMNGDTIYGAFRISRMVSYAEGLGMNVLAAVNTDFFSMSTGVPLGLVIEEGVYKSSSDDGRNALCFGNDGNVFFVRDPKVSISLLNNGAMDRTENPGGENGEGNDGAIAGNAGKVVNLVNFNKFRMDTGGMYLFSEAFSTVSTRTSSPGWFVKFRILEGVPSASGKMTLEVVETLRSDGAITIGEGYMVLTAANECGYGEEYEKFAVGDIVTMSTNADDERLKDASYATGSGCVIVEDGAKTDRAGWDPALLSRAPRTVFGAREDGSIVSYVIDGRNSTHSVGLTLDELADEMLQQGCVFAVNMDGGGSSALAVRIPGDKSATVVNQPSGGSERSCATYILFVTDTAPRGEARNLSLKNNGVVVLAGSTVTLGLAATNLGYMPVNVPGDVVITPAAGGALISGMTYTAGDSAGVDALTLFSPSTGATGTGEVFVITRPTSLTAARRGVKGELTTIRLVPGETLEIEMTATYYRRPVTAQAGSFEYTISGDIGEMTGPGVFTASRSILQSGTITVSAGGRTAEIMVEIGGFTDMVGHWAREYAEYLAIEKIVTGVTYTEYVPEQLMKRGDFCLMLYRSAGEPDFTPVAAFDDVALDMYYSRAVAWARAAGIAEAADGNDFIPESPISRQDAFIFVYRALSILGKQYHDGTPGDLELFEDAAELADGAVVPAATLVALGIVEGTGGGLEPLSGFTRAQMAKLVASVLQLQG